MPANASPNHPVTLGTAPQVLSKPFPMIVPIARGGTEDSATATDSSPPRLENFRMITKARPCNSSLDPETMAGPSNAPMNKKVDNTGFATRDKANQPEASGSSNAPRPQK